MIRSFTVDELCLSPLNVRTNEEDANATLALEASIEARGLIFPLIVHPLGALPDLPEPGQRTPATHAVLAGGRRFRAISRLVDAGRLAPDWAIDCVVRDVDPAEITEISLAENLLRRDLRPYEVHAAIARAIAQGATEEEVALNIGQRLDWVRQQLRLGRLHPDLFAAYAEGNLSVDQARAYAATEDQELQRLAWAHFAHRPSFDHTPGQVRAFLKVGDREAARLLRFVGSDVYRAAGGGFELDLFADGPEETAHERGRIVDDELLRKLAETKLELLRQDARRRCGNLELRFLPAPPHYAGGTDYSLELHPEERADGTIALPAGDIVATLGVREDGEPELRWWWESRKAMAAAARTGAAKPVSRMPAVPAQPSRLGAAFEDRASPGAAQTARQAVKDEHGLTADGIHVIRSLRRELLRALLVQDAETGIGELGRDYVIWSQLRLELTEDRKPAIGALGLSGDWNGSEDAEPRETVRPFLEASQAHAVWRAAVDRIEAMPFIAIEDPAAAFAAYVAAGDADKRLAGAVLAGLALLRSAQAAGWQIPVHDRLADLAGGDDVALRALWAPDEAFAELFPRAKLLDLVEPFVEPEMHARFAKMKSAELLGPAARALAGEGAAPRLRRAKAAAWVHPLLSFGASQHCRAADVDWTTREAAE